MRERDRTLLGRVLGDGEPPAWWGVPIGRLAGCEIRIHLVLLVFVLGVLVYSIWNGLGLPFVATGLASLAAVVLLREAARGHALVRWARLRPIDITLWPMGGVWRFEEEAPPAKAEAMGAALALAMTAGLAVAAAVLVVLTTGDAGLLVFNPIRPGLALAELEASSTPTLIALIAIWQLYAAALYVLAANLLPMLPLDGGLLLRFVTRNRHDSDSITSRVGLITAAVLLLGGLLTGLPLVAALGCCGGVVCWHARQAERFVLDPAGVDRWRQVLAADDGPDEKGEATPPIPPDERERIELILAKISEQGMASLTRTERRELQRATEKLRSS